MTEDLNALKILKEHRCCIDSLIHRMESGQKFTPTIISVDSLLCARDCLASARTEEIIKRTNHLIRKSFPDEE